MLTLRDILLGMLMPLLVGGVIVAAQRWVRRAAGLAAVAVAGGMAAGYWAIFGNPGIRPANQFEWVVHATALAGVLGLMAGIVKFRVRWVWGVGMPVVAWLVLRGQLSVGAVAGAGVVGWVWWVAWDALVARAPGPWVGVVMTGVAGFTALVLMLSDSQRFGQIGLALVGAAAGVWIVGAVLRVDAWRAASVAWGVALYGLLLDGRFWAGLSWTNAVLLMVGPLMAWVGEVPGVRNLTGWKRSLVRVAAVIVPVAAAAVIAAVAFAHAQESSGSEYY